MSVFLGIGLGPIQSGIFIAGAFRGGFDRIVIAEVDAASVAAIRENGQININIAGINGIRQEVYGRIEIYNPLVKTDLNALIQAAAEASELSTALPDVSFYRHVAPWLREGFARQPERQRFVYAAENNNRAAEILHEEIGQRFSHTHYLNTVIGKMCKVFKGEETPDLPTLCAGLDKGHLVEEFERIYISSIPQIAERQCHNLYPKEDLRPFEETKLYGHNAVHFLLGWKAAEVGLTSMSELSARPDLMAYGRQAFIHESGAALCRKWGTRDPLFEPEAFAAYSDDLLMRMTNPFLSDTVSRVIRDLSRKLAYEDRIIGTIRLCLEQRVIPKRFIETAGAVFLRNSMTQ